MPISVTGERADVVMDNAAVISRMNAGRLYEIYFNAASRHTKLMIQNCIALEHTTLPTTNDMARYIVDRPEIRPLNTYTNAVIDNAFNLVLGLLEIIDTEQYPAYLSLTDRSQKEYILNEVINKELFILYKVSSKKKPYQIVTAIRKSIYKPIKDKISYNFNNTFKISDKATRIAPAYTFLLAKTADSYLSSASAKVNHYGIPISVGNTGRNQTPWRNSPVKILSETEVRLYAGYCGRVFVAELLNRAGSIEAHKIITYNILTADNPTDIAQAIDRDIYPYDGNAAMELVTNMLNAAGKQLVYVQDDRKQHEEC